MTYPPGAPDLPPAERQHVRDTVTQRGPLVEPSHKQFALALLALDRQRHAFVLKLAAIGSVIGAVAAVVNSASAWSIGLVAVGVFVPSTAVFVLKSRQLDRLEELYSD